MAGAERDAASQASEAEVRQRASLGVSEAAAIAPGWFVPFVESAADHLDEASSSAAVSEVAAFSRVLPAARLARVLVDLDRHALPADVSEVVSDLRAELEAVAAAEVPHDALSAHRVAEMHAALVLVVAQHSADG